MHGGAGRGFSFGTAATTTSSSSFGGTPAGTSGGGFSFGTQAASAGTGTTASSGTGFSFAGATGSSAAGGLSLGQQALSESLGVNLRSTAPVFGVAGTQPSAASAPGFNLTTTAQSTGLTLGGSGSSTGTVGGFNLGGSGTTTVGAAQTTSAGGLTGLLSGTPSSGTTLGTGTGTGLLSGLLAAPITTTASATGFTLGGGSTAAATTTSSGFKLGALSTTTSTTGLNLGGGGLGSSAGGLKLGSTPTTQSATTAATTTASGFGFGVQATSASGYGLSTTGSSTGGFPLAGAISTSKPSTTTAATTASVPSRQMNYRQLEDQINKWMIELEEQERLFLQQATQVNAWDRLLVDNGEKITQLNGDMERVKVDQNKLEQELDFIKSQQRELEELLVPMEKSLEMLPNTSLQPHADLERENTYQLADNIDAQLKRMVRDLKEIIDHLNTSSSTQDNNDPILQITRILNAHMDSLQWIDTNTALLNRRVEEIGKQMESQRKNQERDFRLVYD